MNQSYIEGKIYLALPKNELWAEIQDEYNTIKMN